MPPKMGDVPIPPLFPQFPGSWGAPRGFGVPPLPPPQVSGCPLPGDVVFGVLAVVGQTPEQVTFVAHQGEAVAQPGTRGGPVFGGLRLQSLPLPPGGLEWGRGLGLGGTQGNG